MTTTPAPDADATADRHLAFGWWALLVFLTLGLFLEALHGFKLPFYVDGDVATRRHMWTLAHAHGTLLALVQIAFAASLRSWPDPLVARAKRTGGLLLIAALLMPLGFFLGGLVIYSGDPGLGILLVPVGGLALLLGVLGAARGVAS